MGEFTAQDAIRPRWDPALKQVAIRRLLYTAAALVAIAFVGGAFIVFAGLAEGAILWLILVIGPFASAVAAVLLAVVIRLHAIIGRLLERAAFGVFLGAVIGMVVFAWAVALLFECADSVVAAHYASQGAGAPACGCLTTNQMLAQLPGGVPQKPRNDPPFWTAVSAYLIWPFQFRIVRDVILALGALGMVSITASFAIWWERKVAGRIQSRLGPMRVGGWHGWAQSIADGLKLVQKEDIVVAGADRPLFRLAPYLVFIPVLAAFIALPFGAGWAFRDLDVALIFILSMVGIDVVGVIIGGWASNNKWSVYGAMRVACQMVSYEIPMGMSLLVPVMTVGTLNLTRIGEAQAGGFQTWLAFANPFTFIAAGVYFIASLASCKRAPFDLPEAESELVAGFHTEYSGFRWAVFFFGEYGAMFVVAGLATVLFFGAWYSPLPAA
ncbi:MAG: NADH-quinone oxidoreductase subunit H, partial [Planctomycetes bacterium]|nr:NADH-quinone oxidoreductase subunit H [Planctomycetota bacterium]